jgi:hypothetical protein
MAIGAVKAVEIDGRVLHVHAGRGHERGELRIAWPAGVHRHDVTWAVGRPHSNHQ